MTYEEFERASETVLRNKANACFARSEVVDAVDKPALFLEAQFYMNEIARRGEATVVTRDLLLELVIIALILLEIVIGVYEGNKQASVLASLETSASATAQTLKNTLSVTPQYGDPCATSNKKSTGISQTGSTVLLHLSGRIWVCYLMVIGADEENVSLVTGGGRKCSQNTLALVGGFSAAKGLDLAGHGGFSAGSGSGSIAVAPAGNDVCLLQSGSGRVAGTLSYAITSF